MSDSPRSRAAPADSGTSSAAAFSPLYQQIKSLLVKSLDAGEWKPGESIPSEIELAARFQVSQGTVRKAIDELASQNILLRRQGKGTFVATHLEPRVRFRFLRLAPTEGEPARGSHLFSTASSTCFAIGAATRLPKADWPKPPTPSALW